MTDITPIKRSQHQFSENEHGIFCPHCGHTIQVSWGMDKELNADSECPECGFPEISQEWIEENA